MAEEVISKCVSEALPSGEVASVDGREQAAFDWKACCKIKICDEQICGREVEGGNKGVKGHLVNSTVGSGVVSGVGQGSGSTGAGEVRSTERKHHAVENRLVHQLV